MSKQKVDRRGFLRGAAAGAASMAAQVAVAQTPNVAAKPVAETGATVEVTGNERPGSDFMIDVIKSLGIEYCAANTGFEFPRSAGIDD